MDEVATVKKRKQNNVALPKYDSIAFNKQLQRRDEMFVQKCQQQVQLRIAEMQDTALNTLENILTGQHTDALGQGPSGRLQEKTAEFLIDRFTPKRAEIKLTGMVGHAIFDMNPQEKRNVLLNRFMEIVQEKPLETTAEEITEENQPGNEDT